MKGRFEIIIGTAEGLVHLHKNMKTRIIDREIKASNILWDSRLRAKLMDFGLARTFQESESHISHCHCRNTEYINNILLLEIKKMNFSLILAFLTTQKKKYIRFLELSNLQGIYGPRIPSLQPDGREGRRA